MAKSNWNISGSGDQSVIIESGSKRCELFGEKLCLYNGASSLANCQLIADIKLYGTNGYNQGGIILRSDGTKNNAYVFVRKYNNAYYLYKIVNGVWTQMAYAPSTFAYNIWVRTRVRIDGWQISVDEWIEGAWSQIMLINEPSHQHVSGFIGLIGTNTNVIGSILFDNIDIEEKA